MRTRFYVSAGLVSLVALPAVPAVGAANSNGGAAIPVEKPRPVDTSGGGFFYAGQRKPGFSFQVDRRLQARVELVRTSDDTVVRTWTLPAQPGSAVEVTWDGRGVGGAQPTDQYRFRLAGAAASAAAIKPGSNGRFWFYDHLFPIRGRHNMGYTRTNGFGGGRGHQGQDMFARCGTPLAAARGGRVQKAGFEGRAGNYVVIDGAGTSRDYVYMHLRRRALVRTRERVFTGEAIGQVGETGDAVGCHLHFELWRGPGWYEGGSPFDPKPSLRAWDRYS